MDTNDADLADESAFESHYSPDDSIYSTPASILSLHSSACSDGLNYGPSLPPSPPKVQRECQLVYGRTLCVTFQRSLFMRSWVVGVASQIHSISQVMDSLPDWSSVSFRWCWLGQLWLFNSRSCYAECWTQRFKAVIRIFLLKWKKLMKIISQIVLLTVSPLEKNYSYFIMIS